MDGTLTSQLKVKEKKKLWRKQKDKPKHAKYAKLLILRTKEKKKPTKEQEGKPKHAKYAKLLISVLL